MWMGYRNAAVYGDMPAKIYVENDLSRKLDEVVDPVSHFKKLTEKEQFLFAGISHAIVFVRDSDIGVVTDVYTMTPFTEEWNGPVQVDHSQFFGNKYQEGAIQDVGIAKLVEEEEKIRVLTPNLDAFMNIRPIPMEYREIIEKDVPSESQESKIIAIGA